MGAGLLIVVILAVYIAHVARAKRLRGRIEQLRKSRVPITDDQFFSSLQSTSVTKEGAITIRGLVADAVRIPTGLIYPDDTLRELEKIGDLTHPSVIDYIVDVSPVKHPEDEAALITVRDLVARFGPELASHRGSPHSSA